MILVEAEIHNPPTEIHNPVQASPSRQQHQENELADQIEFLDTVPVDEASYLIEDFSATRVRDVYSGCSISLKIKNTWPKIKTSITKKIRENPLTILNKLKRFIES